MTALDAALAYAARGWPVSPWGQRGTKKFPLADLVPSGHLDATLDPDVIRNWWSARPDALISIRTGEISGAVAIDIDTRPEGSGFDTLDELGVSVHPTSPTVHTPRGGCAVLFRWPGHFVKTKAAAVGPFLDTRGDGGSLLLPPGPGRAWDPHLGLDTPLAPMPAWMVIAEPEPIAVDPEPAPIRQRPLSHYGKAALDGAVALIMKAPAGQQRETLNREIYGIARLVAGNIIAPGLAIEALSWAARQIPSLDARRPWRPGEVDKMVRAAFADGLARPRQPERAA
jgi:putative DNA primase/helicase